MPKASLWRALVGVDRRTVIEDVEFDEAAERVMVHVRPRKGGRGRCGRCGRWSWRYDRGEGRRRWRALDLGTIQVHLEAAAPRVRCREHGPTVARLPWARHGAGHTLAFDDTVAWLAVRSSKSAVCELMRIAWRTVGAIVARVWADAETQSDRFGGLRRIGIDEISYKKHHRYLTVVVDHDTGRLVWAAPGRDSATLNRFFDALGERRAAEITHVSADAAQWIADTVARRAPKAIRCADPFHVVAWATEALDAERRRAWNDARALARTEGTRRRGRPATDSPARPGHEKAKKLKDSRYALWKNPEDLTENQQAKLAWIATTDRRLYRALDRPGFCGDLIICLVGLCRCRGLHVSALPEGLLELHRWPVAAPGVQPFMIIPVNPFRGRQGDLGGVFPWAVPGDEFLFVESVDRLCQRIVVGIARTANGSFDPGVGEPFPVTDRGVLNTSIAVMYQCFTEMFFPGPQCHIERV